LFQAGNGWEMRSIKPISKGDQIYNTYGELPNGDLLRRYGYVIPGSRDDLVEIPVELILQTIGKHSEEEVDRRIEILDEEDAFQEFGLRL
jgi:N-lysine methyltransferase SETD6